DDYRKQIEARIAFVPKGAPYPNSIAATFELANEKAAFDHKETETLLGFFALLAPERIPVNLIDASIMSEEDRTEALATLSGVSLVEHVALDNGEPEIIVHRLVQAAMRARLAYGGQTTMMVVRVTSRLAQAFPENAYGDPTVWPRCAALLPHVLAIRDMNVWGEDAAEEASDLLDRTAGYLQGIAEFADAEALYRDAARLSEMAVGRERTTTAIRLNNLANVLIDTGRLAEAESLLREAIAINEKASGPTHSEFAIRTNNLAELLRETGRLAEAEQLYRQALAMEEKTLGREHPTVAKSMNNLARLFRDTGRQAEAERLYREALTVMLKTLGPDHPSTALVRGQLAELL